jgi:hypothetical protein
MSSKFTLKVIDGPLKGTRFELQEGDAFLCGRAAECHLRLTDDTFVSSHHFVIEVRPPGAIIRDLGSLNETYVNGVRVEGSRPLSSGDTIRVGGTTLSIETDAASVETSRRTCAACGSLLARSSAAVLSEAECCPSCKSTLPGSVDLGTPPLGAQDDLSELDGVCRSGGYVIERRLKRGGMGCVYLARRLTGGLRVALKVVPCKGVLEPHALKLFTREMQALKHLHHPHIVRMMRHGAVGQTFYFEMEYCDGGSVADLMSREGGRLPLDLTVTLGLQILQGLEHAHALGFVHRDIKPTNVVLRRKSGQWVAKLCDFGLAKSFDKAGLSGLTASGDYGGTYDFMPREQVTNYKYVRPVSDVWSTGATMYAMLTGVPPRLCSSAEDPVSAVLAGQIVPLQTKMPEAPAHVSRVVDLALALDATDRFQNAREFREALEQAWSMEQGHQPR